VVRLKKLAVAVVLPEMSKVGFSSSSIPFTVVALRKGYSMMKATPTHLVFPRAFQSHCFGFSDREPTAVKNRESGVFGGKFGKAPMQEEDRRARSQLSPMA